MNILFFIMCVFSISMLMFSDPESAYAVMLEGAKNSLNLCFTLCAIYCIWLSILKIMEKSGINNWLAKAFAPVTNTLFKNESQTTKEYISMNLSANLLGMGGAATPLGIKAMESMQDGTDRATDNMILFMVINCTSIQLLPATIIGLRANAGSASPSNIIFPSLIATTISTIIGIVFCLCLRKGKNRALLTKKMNIPNSNMLKNTILTKNAIKEIKRNKLTNSINKSEKLLNTSKSTKLLNSTKYEKTEKSNSYISRNKLTSSINKSEKLLNTSKPTKLLNPTKYGKTEKSNSFNQTIQLANNNKLASASNITHIALEKNKHENSKSKINKIAGSL